jgi:ubiquinone biosynthesis protein
MTVLALLTRKGRFRFKRYRKIVSTLIAYGFDEIVYQTGVGKLLRFTGRIFGGEKRRAGAKGPGQSPTWARVRMAVEELGPTFIKLGQIMSNRPDLIPSGLQDELEKLQENVPPFPGRQAAEVVEATLGQPMNALFREFREDPIAAASIAQIHRAVLPSGREVAVKIQRPGLQELVEVDIEILHELAELIERYVPQTRQVGPRDLVEEFEKAMQQELDFRREAASIERFGMQFADEKDIKVPKVYRGCSSERVLTMEYIDGTPLTRLLDRTSRVREEGPRIARLGARLTLEQIFSHGFFHADPHPGNLVVLDDGRLCYLDFGLTGSLVQRDLEVVSDIFTSIIARNEQKAARAVVRLAGSRDIDTAVSIEREIAGLIDRFRSAQAGDFSFTALLAELVKVLVDRGLRLPPDLFLLVKALITIEGVATALDRHFDFASHLEPFAETLVRERYDPGRVASRVAATAGDYAGILESFPADYYKVVDTISKGRIRMRIEEDSFRPIRRCLMQASTSLVFAVVLGSIIIGSALIVHSRVPPLWHEVPVIGIGGFVVAGLIGFWLLIKIIRSGGL